VAEAGEAREQEKHSPAGRKVRVIDSSASQTPDEIDEADDNNSIERYAKKRMRESAVMSEAERWSPEATEHIEIWSFGGEGQRERGQRGFAIESGASHAGTGQKVGDGFQAVRRIVGT
jgi:hypothetical protein